jgi:hypothetical protein
MGRTRRANLTRSGASLCATAAWVHAPLRPISQSGASLRGSTCQGENSPLASATPAALVPS